MLRNRYRRITLFFARIITNIIFWDLFLAKIGFRKLATRTRPDRLLKIARQFRSMATEMGGVMIKVGQFLSTRVDVLPEIITAELANLQDEVEPECFEDIRLVAETDLGTSLHDAYAHFSEEPMAAASLGQVHEARLHHPHNGFYQVVVKIQRPNIDLIIETDIAALRTVGRWLMRYRPIAKRADIPTLLNEFATVTYQEIDYLTEGKNAETFGANFKNRPGIRVPQVVWSFTTRRVLTLENVFAIKITDYNAITAAGIDRHAVAQRLFEIYLQQIFEDGFFHADPHPGNLFVQPTSKLGLPAELPDQRQPEAVDWTLTFVDFGMVGRLPPNLLHGLREMVIGVGTRDSARLIQSYQTMGILLPGADLDRLKEMETVAFDRFWGKSMAELKEISFDEMHEFAKEFREIIFDMPFQVPENLIFLVRCVAILSGMCTGLNPDFNVWEGLAPFANKIIREEATNNWEFWLAEAGDWGRTLLNLPCRLDSALHKIETGKMAVETPSLNRQAARLERTGRQLISSIVFATLFFSGIQLYQGGETTFGLGLLAASTIPLLRTFLPNSPKS